MNIIIIDDLAPIALTYKAILLRAGYEAEVFTKPVEAYRHLQEFSKNYDLMITDIYMDDMNGVDLLQAAKQLNPAIKTLCITGGGAFDQDTSLMQVARTKADYLAFKPIHSGQLVNMVQNLLKQESKTASNAA